MPNHEIELNPVDFVTVGTVGPKGRRVFYLQAGKAGQIVTVIIEKQQALALAEATNEILQSLHAKFPALPPADIDFAQWDMSLRDPIDPLFRVSQMGLGYDEARDLVVLVAQELLVIQEDEEPPVEPQLRIIRLWTTRPQMRALSQHAGTIVKKGRADPKSNGYMIYYWT
jgi:uncharacterized repeat protein (TIGR03847 family)